MNQYGITTKRQAAKFVRDCANAIIAQGERCAQGWDCGLYRDDDTLCRWTIRQSLTLEARAAFAVAIDFSNKG